jgi:hypothetical protein
MYRGHSFTTIGTSANSKLVANDTASVCFDYAGTGTAPVTGENVTLNCVITDKNVTIRDDVTLSGHETQPFYISKGKMI